MCMHGKLLTNHQRMIRGLDDNDMCTRCNSTREDLKHLFFYSTLSANVWLHFLTFRAP